MNEQKINATPERDDIFQGYGEYENPVKFTQRQHQLANKNGWRLFEDPDKGWRIGKWSIENCPTTVLAGGTVHSSNLHAEAFVYDLAVAKLDGTAMDALEIVYGGGDKVPEIYLAKLSGSTTHELLGCNWEENQECVLKIYRNTVRICRISDELEVKLTIRSDQRNGSASSDCSPLVRFRFNIDNKDLHFEKIQVGQKYLGKRQFLPKEIEEINTLINGVLSNNTHTITNSEHILGDRIRIEAKTKSEHDQLLTKIFHIVQTLHRRGFVESCRLTTVSEDIESRMYLEVHPNGVHFH